jgi:hypothetical protein
VNPKEKEKSDELGEQHQHRLPGGAGKCAERLGKCREDFTPDAVKWADALRIAAFGFAGGGAACRALVQKLRDSTELKDWVARFPTLAISAQW